MKKIICELDGMSVQREVNFPLPACNSGYWEYKTKQQDNRIVITYIWHCTGHDIKEKVYPKEQTSIGEQLAKLGVKYEKNKN